MPFRGLGYDWEAVLGLQVRVSRVFGVSDNELSANPRDLMSADAAFIGDGSNGSSACLQNCTASCPNTTCICPVSGYTSRSRAVDIYGNQVDKTVLRIIIREYIIATAQVAGIFACTWQAHNYMSFVTCNIYIATVNDADSYFLTAV